MTSHPTRLLLRSECLMGCSPDMLRVADPLYISPSVHEFFLLHFTTMTSSQESHSTVSQAVKESRRFMLVGSLRDPSLQLPDMEGTVGSEWQAQFVTQVACSRPQSILYVDEYARLSTYKVWSHSFKSTPVCDTEPRTAGNALARSLSASKMHTYPWTCFLRKRPPTFCGLFDVVAMHAYAYEISGLFFVSTDFYH